MPGAEGYPISCGKHHCPDGSDTESENSADRETFVIYVIRVVAENLRVAVIAILLIGSPVPTYAQKNGGRIVMQFGRAMNGPSPDLNAPVPDLARFEPNRVWLASGEVMVTPRVAVGVEWRKPKDVTFGGGRAVSHYTQIERGHAVFIPIAARVLRGPWGSIDVMGGPGIVYQHVTLTVGGFTSSNTTESVRRLGAITLGADATMQIVKHIGVGTLIRLTGTSRPTEFRRTYSLGLFVRAWL